jgi:glycosyltransferase involved in cell wall biosynthesis
MEKRMSGEISRKKICVVTTSMSRAAAGMFDCVRKLSQCIAANPEFEVAPFAVEDIRSETDRNEWHPLTPQVFKRLGPAKWSYSPSLLRAIADYSPELIHLHGIWQYPSYAVDQFARKENTPIVISPQGMLDSWALNNSKLAKSIALVFFQKSQLLNRVSCIHATGENEEMAVRKFGCKSPVCIVRNGVDLNDFGRTAEPLNPRNRPYLLFLGRLHPKKGILGLVRAWARYTRDSCDKNDSKPCLVIAGWDQNGHRNELTSEVDRLGLNYADSIETWTADSKIVFAGEAFGTKKTSLLLHCDGFILPSLSEGLPLAVLEAWGYSRPVLMTDSCNIPEGFNAKAALRIRNTQTPEEGIVESLRAFFEMSLANRVEMGHRGNELVRSEFTWQKAGERMASVYHWLLRRGERPEWVRVI